MSEAVCMKKLSISSNTLQIIMTPLGKGETLRHGDL